MKIKYNASVMVDAGWRSVEIVAESKGMAEVIKDLKANAANAAEALVVAREAWIQSWSMPMTKAAVAREVWAAAEWAKMVAEAAVARAELASAKEDKNLIKQP